MKLFGNLELDADKKKYLRPAMVVLVLCVIFLVTAFAESSAQKRLRLAQKESVEFASLDSQYSGLKAQVDELDKRVALSPKTGILKTAGDIFASMGLQDRISSIKPMDTTQSGGLTSEKAEVSLKKMDLNQAVNVLYRLENAPMLLTLKEVDLRSSFSAPTLDMRLVLELTSKK